MGKTKRTRRPPAAPGRAADPALDALVGECLGALTAPRAETRAAAVALVADYSGRPAGAAFATAVSEDLLAAALDGPAGVRDAALESLAGLGPLPVPTVRAEASRAGVAVARAHSRVTAPPCPDRLRRLAEVLRTVARSAPPTDRATLELESLAVVALTAG